MPSAGWQRYVCRRHQTISCSTCCNLSCRQSEATAHLGAILTGYDLLAMFVVRKLGLSLGKLDDVTSETKSVHEIKAEVNVFAAQTDPQTVTQ